MSEFPHTFTTNTGKDVLVSSEFSYRIADLSRGLNELEAAEVDEHLRELRAHRSWADSPYGGVELGYDEP